MEDTTNTIETETEENTEQNPEAFKQLEECLLQPELRRSPQDLAALLADEFIEFGCSGRIFDKPQTITVLQSESRDQLTLMNFQAKVLSANVVLTTYQAVRHSYGTEQVTTSLRSSIWKFLDGRWQVVFHQGTSSSKP